MNPSEVQESARGSKHTSSSRLVSALALSIGAGYLLLLFFPRPLFAHEVRYETFRVDSSESLDRRQLCVVLDRVDSLLRASPIDDRTLEPRIVLLDSPQSYAALSLYRGANSFGKGFGALPVDNVFINAHDLAKDLVFRGARENNVRSLSGVIAHEVTHLMVRKRFGYWRNLAFPAWKKEGYAEYVAGGSNLPYATGVRMWKEHPADATGYRYFKSFAVVKYLLEDEGITVDELFDRDIDFDREAARVLESL